MLITTIDRIDGYRIKEVKGLVFGRVGRVRGIWGGILASVEMTIGGRGEVYASELEKAKNAAISAATANAEALGCNAILGVDLDITEVREGYLLASITGTGVILEKVDIS